MASSVLLVSVLISALLILALALLGLGVLLKTLKHRREEEQRRRDLKTKTTGYIVDWVEMPILRTSRPIEGMTRPWASSSDLQYVYPSLDEEFTAPCSKISVSDSNLPCLPEIQTEEAEMEVV